MKILIAKLSNSISQKVIASMVKRLQHYWKVVIALIMSLLLAVTLNPFAVKAFDLSDLFRVLPSAIQIIQLSSIGDNEEVSLGQQIDQQIQQEMHSFRLLCHAPANDPATRT